MRGARLLGLGLALGLGLVFGSAAPAQPMMMDPSKMSGIPRPDPQVPAGTITVRLIRGRLDQRMVGVEVAITSDAGKAQKSKTDAEGRATFAGLAQGAYVASAKEGEVELKSQPIELEAQMGSRVMLVFPAGGLGAADGTPHPDKTLPAGTLVVRAEDAAGQAAEGLDVVVAHAVKDEQKVQELRGKTDVAGEAKFAGLPHGATEGYLVEVLANGAKFPSKPFRLDDAQGARLVLQVRPVSGDVSSLSLAEGSHILCEITDDALQVIEVLRLHNASTSAIDAGEGGLRIPLADGAVQAQVQEASPAFSIAGHEAIWRGPVPPGDTQLRVSFTLPRHDAHAELVQPTPVPFARVALVTQELDGVTVSGHNVAREERDMQGRKISVYFGDATSPAGGLHLVFDGLPTPNATPRYAAAALVIALVVIFGLYASSGGGAARGRLERERRRLFDELVALDAERATAGTDEGKVGDARAKLVARLADVYRGLDELGGG